MKAWTLPTTGGPEGPGTNLSTNPDFPNMWRALHKIVQIDHHTNNWTSLPRTVRRQLYDMADNINPRDPTAELKQNIEDILMKAGGSIQVAIRNHMQSRRAAQVNILKNCDDTDTDRAIARAHKGLTLKLGKHIHNIREKLMKEAAAIGTNKKRPIDQVTTTPPTDNCFKRYRMNGSTPPATSNAYTPEPTENITPDPELELMDEADKEEQGTVTTGPLMTIQNPGTSTPGHADQRPNPVHLLDAISDAMFGIRDETEVAIIADSSFSKAEDQDLYANWQLIRTRSNTLHTISAVLSALPVGRILAAVVIPGPTQGTQSEDRNNADIEDLQAAIATKKFRTKVLGVSMAHTTPIEEQERLRSFNGALQRTFGKNFVFQPPMEVVGLDGHGHYTPRTVYNIGSRIDYHFKHETSKNN